MAAGNVANQQAPFESLEAYARAFITDFSQKCNSCGICLEACSLYPDSVFHDSDPPQAREKLLAFITDGKYAEEVSQFVRSCYYCMSCTEACPQGLNPSRLNDLIRPLLKRRGLLPDGAPNDGPYIYLPDTKYNFMKTLAALQTKPSEKRWLTQIPSAPPRVDTVFFPSCGEVAFPDRLFAKIDLLEKMGINFLTIGPYENQVCCGIAELLAGNYDRAESTARRLLETVERFRPDTVIVGCPGTYRWIRDVVPHFRPYSFRFQHYFTFLSEHMNLLELKPLNIKVTVHDACKLARGGISESDCPRKILQAIPGVEILEMEHTRERTICCGEDLPKHLSHLAKAVRHQRLKEAVATGAQVLTTICPACDHNLSKEAGAYPVRVQNILALVVQSAGVTRYENKIERFRSYRNVDRILAECRDVITENGFTPEELREPVRNYLL